MHTVMILGAIGLAWGLRLALPEFTGNWRQKWHRALFFYLLPPLMLIMTALAVLCMGSGGKMFGLQASWLGYWLAFAFVFLAILLAVRLAYQVWQSQQQILTYPQQIINHQKVHIVANSLPYSAQIGWWQPKLVITQGLLDILDQEHLEAVLAHEQAHLDYRDPFWFLWLGWLRSFTAWLPQTEILWQELLLLREMRADRQAAQQVDPLILAESLLMVAKAPMLTTASFCVPLYSPLESNRLAQRIDALITDSPAPDIAHQWHWSWLLLVLLPWITVPFHY